MNKSVKNHLKYLSIDLLKYISIKSSINLLKRVVISKKKNVIKIKLRGNIIHMCILMWFPVN